MICYRCGRELPDNSAVCKGCGTQLRRRKKVRSAGIGTVLGGTVKVGRRTVKTPVLLICLVLVIGMLIACIYAIPPLIGFFDEVVEDHLRPDDVTDSDSAALIESVSGTVIRCDLDDTSADYVISGESAYDDGRWEQDITVDGLIKLRLLRFKHAESWVNTHIFKLYPDVSEVEQFGEDERPQVSGYSSSRIQINSTTYAAGCVVEALCVSVGDFDYLFICEIPTDSFNEYAIMIDKWFASLSLVDSDTGAEQLNPAAVSDANVVTAADAD